MGNIDELVYDKLELIKSKFKNIDGLTDLSKSLYFSLLLNFFKKKIIYSLGLNQINTYRSTLEKINFLNEFLTDLLFTMGKESRPEMDDFLSVLSIVIIKAKPTHLISNLKYENYFYIFI